MSNQLPYRADDELKGIAAEYVISVADPGDAEYFEKLLKDQDPFAVRENEAFQEVAQMLALSAPAEKPCGGLRAKLLRKIKEPEVRKPRLLSGFVEEAPGFHVLRAGDGKWRPTEHAGIEQKILSYDPAQDALTVLLRMAPGSELPYHRHKKEEQCLVLEGDVYDMAGGLSMKSGDFFRAMPGTDHNPIGTRGGCLLLINGSASNEDIA